jgi:tRNA pseudouridine38-40 synthase
MQRYLLGVQYIGTKFSGWPPLNKRQDGFRSVYYVLEDALSLLAGPANVENLTVSSRTDAGVHAFRNVFSVDVVRRARQNGDVMAPHGESTIVDGLNFYLNQAKNSDVQVVGAAQVGSDVHARVAATSRTYEYFVVSRGSPESGSVARPSSSSMFHRDRAWIVDKYLDTDAMTQAAVLLEGINDFSSFRNSGCQSKSPTRHMYQLSCEASPLSFAPGLSGLPTADLTTANGGTNPPPRIIKFTLNANAYVFRMCRNIVSALVKVGSGELTLSDFKFIFEARDRRLAPYAAPAQGLYLKDVQYNNNNLDWNQT